MGPHSFKCGSSVRAMLESNPNELQWGRTLSSAEVENGFTRNYGRLVASMGPHSFKCGSNGRRKNETTEQIRFNGAALFQVRKYAFASECVCACRRLQWGRTLSSAEVSAQVEVIGFASAASMGPHSFKCGSLKGHLLPDWPGIASMGPHSFKCGSKT